MPATRHTYNFCDRERVCNERTLNDVKIFDCQGEKSYDDIIN